MIKKIFLFIILMRALSAIIITNAHYTKVYPTDLIANGGLLGDVMFFSISGFCLANTSGNFFKWYIKRFTRIYVPVWLMTTTYIALGAYVLTSVSDCFNFFIWPTHWHFIASIILLYIPLFFVSKYIEMNKKNYWRFTIGLFLLQLIVYFTIYDHSYYHIDKVREPMIEFLFFQSMLMGLHFRWLGNELKDNILVNKKIIIIEGGVIVIYFISKMFFVRFHSIADFQIINQIILWVTLYLLFQIFMTFEKKLKDIENKKIWKLIKFISDRTLEIYLVQYVILEYLKIGKFPINWLLLTCTIIVTATLLRYFSQKILASVKI